MDTEHARLANSVFSGRMADSVCITPGVNRLAFLSDQRESLACISIRIPELTKLIVPITDNKAPIEKTMWRHRMEIVVSAEQLSAIMRRKIGLIYNDVCGLGSSGGDYNVLHRAGCPQLSRASLYSTKYFFESESEATSWLAENRTGSWKPCGTCLRRVLSVRSAQ